MADKKKLRKKTSVKRKHKKGTDDLLIQLSLKCPSCGWEWSDSLFVGMTSTPRCMKCFHQPVLIIEATFI